LKQQETGPARRGACHIVINRERLAPKDQPIVFSNTPSPVMLTRIWSPFRR
jgi:hypothetical protein